MEGDEPIYRSVHEAVSVSMSIALRDGYVVPSMVEVMSGSRDTSSRLSIMERHGQAAVILAQIERLPADEQAMAWLLYAKNVLPKKAQVEMAAAVVPRVMARCAGAAYGKLPVAMLVLRSCQYRGYGIRKIAKACSLGWKDVDALSHRVDKAVTEVRHSVHDAVEGVFREKGWV